MPEKPPSLNFIGPLKNIGAVFCILSIKLLASSLLCCSIFTLVTMGTIWRVTVFYELLCNVTRNVME